MAMHGELRGGKKMRPSFTFCRLAAFAVSILLASLHSATAEDSVGATRKLLYLERRKREPVFLERLRGKDNYDLIRRERLRRSEDAIRGYARSANNAGHHREAAPILTATDAHITHQRPRQVDTASAIIEPAPQFATASRAPANCESALPFLKSVKESGGFFCDDDESWNIRKEIARFQQPKQERTSPGHMRALYQENWEPNFSCTYERRLGSPGDGGKWVCDPHKLRSRKDCLIYSFGSENKFDFEEAVLQQIGRNCEVHTFDHTVGPNPTNKPSGVNFHPWGLGIQPSRSAGALKSLDQITDELGHSGGMRQISILKIDVEGAEFDALPPLLSSGFFYNMGVQQVLVEIHKNTPQKVHTLIRAFHQAGYAIFHKEPNIQFPMGPHDVCVEYAFIKLDRAFWTR